jgi:deoxyribodipyrimidine photo-lyase
MSVAIWWLRRDLRLADNPALLAAAGAADAVLALFVLDDALLRPSGDVRRAYLCRCLRDLDERLDGRLIVRAGDPAGQVAAVAAEVDAAEVHVAADFGPYGARRDERVAAALAAAGRRLCPVGSPYAVSPGRVRRPDGGRYRVFMPFYRAWKDHGWRAPAGLPGEVTWVASRSDRLPAEPDLPGVTLPAAGEQAALRRLDDFVDGPLKRYAQDRDRPGLAATSRLSVYLKFGCVHPRTILRRLDAAAAAGATGATGAVGTEGVEKVRSELAWREFYADVLAATPESARSDLTGALASMHYDPPDDRFEAWKWGRTGYPIVDAGMRQLLAEGWINNRVRMIEASFVCKDLHVHWTHGARWFLDRLVDGDLASNNQGWQWTAGTGTDAAPYFRVFNPTAQSRTYDPDGSYLRTWLPELRDVAGDAIHEPWRLPGGPPNGYPAPVVDHATARRDALDRYAAARVR